jgi:hypothetical protein
MNIHRGVKLLIVSAVLIAFPACWTYSLHPIAEENDPHLIYDPALEGTWQVGDNQNEPLLIVTGDQKSLTYSLRLSETNAKDDAPTSTLTQKWSNWVRTVFSMLFRRATLKDSAPCRRTTS